MRIFLLSSLLLFTIAASGQSSVNVNELSRIDSLVDRVFFELAYSSEIIFQNAWQSTMKEINSFVNKNPEKPEGYYYRGMMKGFVQHFEGRLDDYNKALEIDPQFTLALIQRAAALNHQGDPQGALRDLDAAIETGQKLGWIYASKGEIYISLKQLDKACESFNLALNEGYIIEEENLRNCQ